MAQLRFPLSALAATLALSVSPALAQEAGGVRADAAKEPFRAFSSTNVQLLQGYDFDDPLYFTSGRMTTVTINHFSTWEHGDNFLFADFYGGRLARSQPQPNLWLRLPDVPGRPARAVGGVELGGAGAAIGTLLAAALRECTTAPSVAAGSARC
jgi:hypothetical protein